MVNTSLSVMVSIFPMHKFHLNQVFRMPRMPSKMVENTLPESNPQKNCLPSNHQFSLVVLQLLLVSEKVSGSLSCTPTRPSCQWMVASSLSPFHPVASVV